MLQSTNPATGEVIWQGQAASSADVNLAVINARKAFEKWSRTPIAERVALVERYQAALESRKDALAEAIARETGKVLWDAKTEVTAAIGKIAISIKAYSERTGQWEAPLPSGGKQLLIHRPHGVVAVFGPYNFPLHLPGGHIVPALLAGNTVVFKPSEQTPYVAEQAMECWRQAGLPDSVITITHGDRDTGKVLAAHSGIDGIFFTGSYMTGAALNQQFAGQPGKILALEMGGNNPLIVMNTENVTAAAYHAVHSAFITTGQRCTCARRLIVPNGKEGDDFLERFVTMTKSLIIGSWNEQPEPFMGPVISGAQAAKLIAAQAMQERGTRMILRMEKPRAGLPFLTPGIIDVTGMASPPDEEWFGPLLRVIRVNSFDEAITVANRTSYGLAAGLISDSHELFEQFYTKIRAGVISWNRQTTGASSAMPFGGLGNSGNHRPSAYYAADYCAWPMASMLSESVTLPSTLSPGITV